MSLDTFVATGKNFIGGEWVAPGSGAISSRRCPLDHCDLGPYADSSAEDVDAAVTAAVDAATAWGQTAPSGRSAILHRMASVIESHASELADAITHEEGKRASEALGETSYAIGLLRYFAGSHPRKRGQYRSGQRAGGDKPLQASSPGSGRTRHPLELSPLGAYAEDGSCPCLRQHGCLEARLGLTPDGIAPRTPSVPGSRPACWPHQSRHGRRPHHRRGPGHPSTAQGGVLHRVDRSGPAGSARRIRPRGADPRAGGDGRREPSHRC